MGMPIVAENVGVDCHGIDDARTGGQDQQGYPLSGPEEEEQAEPGRNQDQRIAYEERKMQWIAESISENPDIRADADDVEILRRIAVDMGRARHLREPVETAPDSFPLSTPEFQRK